MKISAPLLTVAALVLFPAAAHATFAGSNGRIALAGLDDSVNGNVIFTVRPGGKRERLVMRGDAPSWSPDGRRMVVVRKGGIWIAGARGGHPVEVVPARRIHDVPFDPVWSPDATKIAFAVVRDEEAPRDTVKEFEEIWTVAANGTELRKLVSGSSPAWSADGRRIAYARRDGSVAWARSDGSDEVVLEHLGGYTRSLDLSPDGRRLVFQNRNSVKVLDVRTGRMRGFPEKRAGNPVQVRWTPDGRRIAYLQWNVTKNGPWDPSEVRTIRPNGRGMRVVLTVREQLLPFKFSWQAR